MSKGGSRTGLLTLGDGIRIDAETQAASLPDRFVDQRAKQVGAVARGPGVGRIMAFRNGHRATLDGSSSLDQLGGSDEIDLPVIARLPAVRGDLLRVKGWMI